MTRKKLEVKGDSDSAKVTGSVLAHLPAPDSAISTLAPTALSFPEPTFIFKMGARWQEAVLRLGLLVGGMETHPSLLLFYTQLWLI